MFWLGYVNNINPLKKLITDSGDLMFNTTASYWGGPDLNHGLKTGYPEFLVVLLNYILL